MSQLDLNQLRRWLDEQESFARAVPAGSPQAGLAREMLAVIAEARTSLIPSADATANYVPGKRYFEQLGELRKQAEQQKG